MSTPLTDLGTAGIDPIPPAALFALVAGGLAIAYPYFDGLTVALAALLAISWIVRRPASSLQRSLRLPPRILAGAVAAVGWAFFLAGPPAFDAVRGALLGVSGLPLWLWFRSDGAHPPAGTP
ncbi:MAG: hypothetical protein L3K17_01535 [Thermoplasmata archaeon]|nr:hypothetical protein [Thermoplasmata archaeon]